MERLIRFTDVWNHEVWINPAMVVTVTQEKSTGDERGAQTRITLCAGKDIVVGLSAAQVLRQLGIE